MAEPRPCEMAVHFLGEEGPWFSLASGQGEDLGEAGLRPCDLRGVLLGHSRCPGQLRGIGPLGACGCRKRF